MELLAIAYKVYISGTVSYMGVHGLCGTMVYSLWGIFTTRQVAAQSHPLVSDTWYSPSTRWQQYQYESISPMDVHILGEPVHTQGVDFNGQLFWHPKPFPNTDRYDLVGGYPLNRKYPLILVCTHILPPRPLNMRTDRRTDGLTGGFIVLDKYWRALKGDLHSLYAPFPLSRKVCPT